MRKDGTATFEKLPRRLETRHACDRGLLFGQMLPITAKQVSCKKRADDLISKDEETRNIIYDNLALRKLDSIPEKARPSFEYLKKQTRSFGMSAFEDKQFRQAFRIVATAIHTETLKVVNTNIDFITNKAQNYLDNHYLKFLREKVFKNNAQSEVKMPRSFTKIDQLIKFLKLFNNQK